MPLNTILRHPVGRRPSPVRWYLALMAVLALVLGAAHFAMQVHAQDEAERLIGQWVDPSAVTIGEVRYRMLRGALTLMDVRVQQEGLVVQIPMIELHGYLSALATEKPRLDLLRIHDAHLQVTVADSNSLENINWQLLYRHQIIARLWAAAKDIQVTNLRGQWLFDDGSSDSVLFSHIQLKQLNQAQTGRELSAVGSVFGGDVHITALETDSQLSSGHLIWDQLQTRKAQSTFPDLARVEGVLAGQLDWQRVENNWRIHGSSHLEQEGKDASSKLTFDGQIQRDKWQARVSSQAWPVQMFASYLPDSKQFQLVAADMDGEIKMRGQAGHWRVSMKEAQLHRIRLQSKNDPAQTWILNEASSKGLLIRWPNRTLWMDQLTLNDGEWPIEIAETETQWKGIVQKIKLQRIKPVILSSGDEVLRLPIMKGHAGWGSKHGLSINIRNAEVDEDGHEVWRISGDTRDKVNIRFNDVSAARFRGWLPKTLRDKADALSGKVSSKLIWSHDSQGGGLTGIIKASDVNIKMGSERWLLKKCRIDLGQIGPQIAEQWIKSVRVKGWHYQAALKPLSVMATEAPSENVALLEPHWRVDTLKMSQGVISAGSDTGIWIKDVTLRVQSMQHKTQATINIAGKLNDGKFTLSSTFDPFAKGFAADMIKVDIHDALPFFIGDWLQVSGMPRITRGRLYMDMSIKRQQNHYQGRAYMRLHYGALEDTVYPNDPMVKHTGYPSHDLYNRLDQGRSARLFFPIKMDALHWRGLGQSLLTELNKELAKGAKPVIADSQPTILLSQVRLRHAKQLTANEKFRLRATIEELQQHPQWMVELQPYLGTKPLDSQMIQQARYTQDLLTAYIVRGGISRARVLPVWPQVNHRSDQVSGSIQLIARP